MHGLRGCWAEEKPHLLNRLRLEMPCIISVPSSLVKTGHLILIKTQSVLGNVAEHLCDVGNPSLFLYVEFTLYNDWVLKAVEKVRVTQSALGKSFRKAT